MKKKRQKKTHTTFNIVVLIFSMFIMVIGLVVETSTYKDYKLHKTANFKLVEATLSSYESFIDHNIVYYTVFYEYVDKNGKEYTGIWRRAIRPEEDAKAMIGSKVNVYYDEKLGICDTNNDTSPTGVIIGAVIIVICAILFIMSFIKILCHYKKLNSNK